MRANRKFRENKKGEIGIGTMIVFIASILVSAVAAGVLISTSEKLQDRSHATGDQATKQIASNLLVHRIVGSRTATSDADLLTLDVYLALAPGASNVDLKAVVAEWRDGSIADLKTFMYNSDATLGFSIVVSPVIRDVDSSLGDPATGASALSPGDIVILRFDLSATGLDLALAPGTSVGLVLAPEVGTPVHSDFHTPESYGSDLQIDLR